MFLFYLKNFHKIKLNLKILYFQQFIYCYTPLQGNVLRNFDNTELAKKVSKIVNCDSLQFLNDIVSKTLGSETFIDTARKI